MSPLECQELLVFRYVQSTTNLQPDTARVGQTTCGQDSQFVGGVGPQDKDSGHSMFIIIKGRPHVSGPDREIGSVARCDQSVACCSIVMVSAACEIVHVR